MGSVAVAERPSAPDVAGDLRIASLNVLNLFNGDGKGGAFPTERGAETFAQYQLQQQKLVASVQALKPDIAALMEIEITEEATLDTQAAGAELARLEAAGFRLAVDDFGMGHSSLAYLVSLHIDWLKIDRSFVKGIATSRENQALIAALIGIGHALSIDIVVEGVEEEEEAEILRMLGCRHAQGYYFARPMPAAEIPRWLDQHAERMAGTMVVTP